MTTITKIQPIYNDTVEQGNNKATNNLPKTATTNTQILDEKKNYKNKRLQEGKT